MSSQSGCNPDWLHWGSHLASCTQIRSLVRPPCQIKGNSIQQANFQNVQMSPKSRCIWSGWHLQKLGVNALTAQHALGKAWSDFRTSAKQWEARIQASRNAASWSNLQFGTYSPGVSLSCVSSSEGQRWTYGIRSLTTKEQPEGYSGSFTAPRLGWVAKSHHRYLQAVQTCSSFIVQSTTW